jgi:hypothetical protein
VVTVIIAYRSLMLFSISSTSVSGPTSRVSYIPDGGSRMERTKAWPPEGMNSRKTLFWYRKTMP